MENEKTIKSIFSIDANRLGTHYIVFMSPNQTNLKNNWNDSYSRKENYIFEPYEELVKFIFRFVLQRSSYKDIQVKQEFSLKKISELKVLDFGCGIGGQSIYLSKLGFQLTGVDHSQVAISEAIELASFLQQKIRFRVTNDNILPEDLGSFDIVIACASLDSMPKITAQSYIQQITNILNPNGLLFATLIGESNISSGLDEIVVNESFEYETVQSFFDLSKIQLMFGQILQIERLEKISYETFKPLTINRSSSRWYLVAKKQ